jgi:hypothetical protein
VQRVISLQGHCRCNTHPCITTSSRKSLTLHSIIPSGQVRWCAKALVKDLGSLAKHDEHSAPHHTGRSLPAGWRQSAARIYLQTLVACTAWGPGRSSRSGVAPRTRTHGCSRSSGTRTRSSRGRQQPGAQRRSFRDAQRNRKTVLFDAKCPPAPNPVLPATARATSVQVCMRVPCPVQSAKMRQTTHLF